MPSQHMYYGRVWNLIQAFDVLYNLAIRKCTSPPLLAPRFKFSNENLLPRQGSNPGPAEPEADMLPSEPARKVVKEVLQSSKYLTLIFF